MKQRKAQMKIQQMVFMLVAVTLFFVLVGILVLGFGLSGIKQSATQLEEKNAMLLVSKIANSPELSCDNAFGKSRLNCVDADKVMMLKEMNEYRDFWGKDTNIEIRKIYPEGEIVCDRTHYPNCNIINLQSRRVSGEYSNFVTLCWKENGDGEVYDRCTLAKIMVSYKDWEEVLE
jgi:hypothetical protein